MNGTIRVGGASKITFPSSCVMRELFSTPLDLELSNVSVPALLPGPASLSGLPVPMDRPNAVLRDDLVARASLAIS